MNVQIWIDPIDEIAHVWLSDGSSFRLTTAELRRLKRRGELKLDGLTLRLRSGEEKQ